MSTRYEAGGMRGKSDFSSMRKVTTCDGCGKVLERTIGDFESSLWWSYHPDERVSDRMYELIGKDFCPDCQTPKMKLSRINKVGVKLTRFRNELILDLAEVDREMSILNNMANTLKEASNG